MLLLGLDRQVEGAPWGRKEDQLQEDRLAGVRSLASMDCRNTRVPLWD